MTQPRTRAELPGGAAPPEVLARLHRTLASLCRGGTLVLGPDAQRLGEALGAAGHPRTTALPASAAEAAAAALEQVPPESWRTVVLAELLPAADDAATALLDAAFARVKEGGRLVLLVPHVRAAELPGARKRRELEKLVRRLGKPKFAVDQPYRWLLLHVRKRGAEDAAIPPAVAERYRLIAGLCRGSVLELGCGPGHLAAAIARAGHTVTGMDLNGPKIAEAAARYPHLRFFQGDAAALRDTGRYDTVVIAEVLEHVPPAIGDRILANGVRSLASRGRLVVSVPNEKCIPHPNHVRLFDDRTLRALLRPFGRPRRVIDQPFKWLLMYVDRDE